MHESVIDIHFALALPRVEPVEGTGSAENLFKNVPEKLYRQGSMLRLVSQIIYLHNAVNVSHIE